MNAEQLLEHYECLAEAPNAVVRLRRFVLDLAVRGKLTEFPLAARDVHELGTISEFVMGQAPPGPSCNSNGDGTIFVKVGEFGDRYPRTEVWTTEPLKHACAGDVLICVVGATIGKLNLGIDCAIGRSVAAIRPRGQVDQVFLYYSLMPVMAQLRDGARGSAQGVISRPDLASIRVWLPPLAEQHRIVAKVDELMALCDRLEAARAEREATRDRLTASTLARLNTPEPPASSDGDASKESSFQSDARFALNVLPALTNRPNQIGLLRQTILNLAVEGRLVPQDTKDEPAESLLSKLRKGRKSSDRDAHERSCRNLPQGWASARLQDVAEVGTGLTPSKDQPRYYDGGNIPWINSGATSRKIIDSASTFITEAAVRECRLKLYPVGSLLVALYGQGKTRGQVAELGIAATVNQALAVVRWVPGYEGLKGYVRLALTQQYVSMREQAEGGPQPNLNVGKIKDLPLSVPPLAEQHRIVAKVDELMSLCDQLEASLARGENTRSRLLNALLHEALQPGHDNVIDLEAARQRLLERRQAVACRTVERLSRTKGFGRLRAVKPLYFAEAHCGVALGGEWGRGPFGPYDPWILSFESQATSACWFTRVERQTSNGDPWVEYTPGSKLGSKAKAAAEALGDRAAEFERVLALLADLNTDESEIVATLYAAWNDLLLEGKPVSDEIVICEFREHWGVARKSSFAPKRLQQWLDWMRQHRLTPTGKGPSTRHQANLL